jgi:hypothetical protein
MTTTGVPFVVVPAVPPDDSIRSTWLRTPGSALGAYSPSNGMASVHTGRQQSGLN